ncbi:MAG: hypothetical protein ACOCTO_03045 [Marinilabiliaceae bacterium]
MYNIFQSDHKSDLQIREKSGPITIDELLNFTKFINRNSDNKNNSRRLILDFRQAWLSSDLKEVANTRLLCKKHPNLFRKHHIAVVTNDPRIVASAILLKPEVAPFSIRPFSTIEEAERWIDLFI